MIPFWSLHPARRRGNVEGMRGVAWMVGGLVAVIGLGVATAVLLDFARDDKPAAVAGRAASASVSDRLPPDLAGRIVFQSNRDGASRIYVLDRQGVRRVTAGPGNDMKPVWSPDGHRIAFFSDRDGNTEIYTVDADGTNRRRLTTSPGHDENPAWSPDGRRIVFDSDRDATVNLWTMDADGANPRRLTNYRVGKAVIPAWSPDGRWIAFTSNMRLGWRVSVIDVEGRNERVLASERGDCRPAWSPDGRTVAFVSVRGDGKGGIWVVGLDGRDPRRVTTDADLYDYNPAWSPDGRRIVFAAGPEKERYKLFVIDADGANRRQLTFGDAFDTFPSWTK